MHVGLVTVFTLWYGIPFESPLPTSFHGVTLSWVHAKTPCTDLRHDHRGLS